MKIIATLAAAGVVAGLTAVPAAAQFPDRPITWVVPYTPGGITDTGSRIIAEVLGKELGQTVVVENRPGAGGMVGTEYVARAEPDGYTILYGTQGTMAANVSLRKALKYDPLTDFAPVHGMGASVNTVVTYADAPYSTIQELVDYGKAHPGELNFGSAGVGTSTHLSMELFKTIAGIEGLHVPYKGSAPAMNDLLAGRVDVLFDYPVSSLGHAEAGTLKVLAVNSPERIAILPDAPTLAESGYPDATAGSWSMIMVPAGVPEDRMKILTDAAEKAIRSDTVKNYYEKYGSTLLLVKGDAATDFIEAEIDRWADVIATAGVPKQ
ncbi:Tripartite-type tricarboxylate transporter, receptor component TctC [Albimonas donghaensis]|uniref:Tripartite-type tricarboxylate transporter, receptor component TctC n=1 Tax=Albimonas donghaensis TaxID=356660 RepID=A0A1H3DMC9_9RHOB|nr:tripartite tricarboxylate transporter substrate binding protein [Albimonas donghaensis]SDX66809.1 Tripartite-type tricarboxylate transporter, receptor component TctC [Albimonas donghaensis]